MIDSPLTIPLVFAAGIILLGLAAIVVLRGNAAQEMETRVKSAIQQRATAGDEAPPQPMFIRRALHWLGQTVRSRKIYSDKDVQVLEGMIVGSGMNPARWLPVILGLKVTLAIAMPLLAYLYAVWARYSARGQLILVGLGVAVGLMGPDIGLKILRRPYQAALRRGIPDALDLLVVCSEAGMALESALGHVSHEMRHSNPAIASVLARLLDELQILPDRREAFDNFATRTGADGARRMSTMLGQAMQYGTPLSGVLRTIAVDLRRERMQALETKAARLPVLLTLPLIMFVMPCLFIILTGPSLLGFMDSMRMMSGKH